MYHQECAVVLPEKSSLWELKLGIIKIIFYYARCSVFSLGQQQNSEYDSSLQEYLIDLAGCRCLSTENLVDHTDVCMCPLVTKTITSF